MNELIDVNDNNWILCLKEQWNFSVKQTCSTCRCMKETKQCFLEGTIMRSAAAILRVQVIINTSLDSSLQRFLMNRECWVCATVPDIHDKSTSSKWELRFSIENLCKIISNANLLLKCRLL